MSRSEFAATYGGLEVAEFFVRTANLDGAVDHDSLLDRIAAALEFPGYYGKNWDAFNDCVGDLMWLPVDRIVLALSGLQSAEARLPKEVALLRKILEDTIVSFPRGGGTFDAIELTD